MKYNPSKKFKERNKFTRITFYNTVLYPEKWILKIINTILKHVGKSFESEQLKI